eukprot:TRINITY_DN25349_c0_g1_i1.p1 TRINITY_DN25349_c0_g1~~TRINITY_DN25349_c0_g1_i1.p1  ORF type:complete len:303 (+),score=22.06 TRINITY_DN25349_c0_g1_i1:32-910(+)
MGRSTLRAACLAGCLWLLLGGLPSGMSRSALILRSLHRYPVKSCAGHESAEARIARDGLLGDRSYVVSWQGQGLTQRECPRLAAIQTELDEQHLRLSSASTTQAPLEVPFREEGADTRSSIFGASINGVDQGEEAASWISEFVDKPGCRLLRRSAGCKRQAVGYHWADIAPLLVVSTASLQGLSGSAQKDILMNRFRPNLVLEGVSDPHEEDTWRRIRIGDVELEAVGPCDRCQTVEVDQEAGEPDKSFSVFGALVGYRGQPVFGFYYRPVLAADASSEHLVLKAGTEVVVG